MKLQKLLKKLALPVFSLAVVGMLAACSSPSGGGSGSGSGTGDGTKTDPNNPNGTQQQGTEGNEGNEGHKQNGGSTGGGSQQGGATTVDTVYTFEEYDEEEGITFNYTITAKKDGTYVATVKMQMGGVSIDMPVEEGTYVLKGDKVTTTSTKEINEETGELEDVSEPLTKTFKIGANNVLTPDMSGSSGSGSSTPGNNTTTKPEEQGEKTPASSSGIDSIKDDAFYTVTAISAGVSNTMQNIPGSSVKSTLRMLPEDAYTISGTTITIDYSKAGQGGTGGQPSQGGKTTISGDDELDPEQIPASWYKIYYGNNMVDAMSANTLDGFAYAVGLVENTDYTIDHTAKKITLTDSGYQKASSYYSNH